MVVQLLPRDAEAQRERTGRGGLDELAEQPGAHRVERDRGRRRVLDHRDVSRLHPSTLVLTTLFVNTFEGVVGRPDRPGTSRPCRKE